MFDNGHFSRENMGTLSRIRCVFLVLDHQTVACSDGFENSEIDAIELRFWTIAGISTFAIHLASSGYFAIVLAYTHMSNLLVTKPRLSASTQPDL